MNGCSLSEYETVIIINFSLPISSKQAIFHSSNKCSGIPRKKPKEIKTKAVLNSLIDRKFSLKQIFVLYHRCMQKIGIIAHILFMYHFTPHPRISDLFYPYPWNLYNIVMTAKSIDSKKLR